MQSSADSKVFELSEELSSGAVGDTYVFPEDCGKITFITLSLIAPAGTGSIDVSESPRDEILAGGGEWWDSWLGTVTNDSDQTIMPAVTGFRLNRVAGTVKMEMLAE